MRIRVLVLLSGMLTVAGALACTDDGPVSGAKTATIAMRFLTPATVKSVVVEVTGPGISPAVVANFSVGTDTVATDSLTLPAGSARRFVVTAVDTAGIETHRADTTIALQPGSNPNLAMRLEPLASSLGITVTFGGSRLTIADTSARALAVGEVDTIVATATTSNASTVPAEELSWGTSNPAVVSVTAGVIRGIRPGLASISARYGNASARVNVVVTELTAPVGLSGTLLTSVGSTPSNSVFSLTSLGGTPASPSITSETVLFTGGFAGSIAPDLSFILQGDLPNSDRMWRRNAPSWTPANIFGTGARDYGPRVSPDGSKVVWFRETTLTPSAQEIWIGNPNGTGGTQLTTNSEPDHAPDISSDNQKIVWAKTRSGQMNIWVMNADGSNPVQLTSSATNWNPRFSPDNSKIAFLSQNSGSIAIWVMNADGSSARELPATRGLAVTVFAGGPLWSPDGQTLVFTGSPVGGVNGVYFTPADGSGTAVRLRANTQPEEVRDWR